MLTRRAAVAALGAPAILRSQPKQPNFLFILADDHAGYVLGAAGNPLAVTPNLDRLAAEGVHFRRHFCNSPVCTPSRQSFFTGQMPSMAGVTVLRTPLAEDKPTLARQLNRAGFATAAFGKMHFNRPSRPGLHGLEHARCEDAMQKAWAQRPVGRPVDPAIPTKPPWRPFKDPARIWLNADKLPYARYEADMKGTFIAGEACRYLEENRNRRFALWVSFHEPHSPFDFPIEDTPRFDPAKFTPPRVGPEDAWQIPLIFRDLSQADKQGIIAAYYTATHFLDRNIGRVLAKLRELGLEDNTWVVYMADHGYSLGHHGRFEKHCGYDPALHVPLIMRWPGRLAPRRVDDLTEHIDVSATITDMLGVEPLPVQHGQSLRPYLEGRRPARPRDHIFSQYLENEEAFIRTDRWKYIIGSGKRRRDDGYLTDNPTPGRYQRLFDLRADPGEFTDVAARNPKLVARFQELILARYRRTHPEAEREPANATREEKIEFYLRPRDAA